MAYYVKLVVRKVLLASPTPSVSVLCSSYHERSAIAVNCLARDPLRVWRGQEGYAISNIFRPSHAVEGALCSDLANDLVGRHLVRAGDIVLRVLGCYVRLDVAVNSSVFISKVSGQTLHHSLYCRLGRCVEDAWTARFLTVLEALYDTLR
jgi:hypothetical protein